MKVFNCTIKKKKKGEINVLKMNVLAGRYALVVSYERAPLEVYSRLFVCVYLVH